jgi:8-oxo-dGTP pyrophosphatase MutT (NUDIX family)
MPISEYLKRLREIVGKNILLVPSASVFIRNAQGGILLQQRADNLEWVLPGGAMDPGESITQAAVRELHEETGLNIEVTRLVGVYSDPANIFSYDNGDQVHAIVLLFEGKIISGILKPDGEETTHLDYFPIDQLPDNLSDQQKIRISDAVAKSAEAFIR